MRWLSDRVRRGNRRSRGQPRLAGLACLLVAFAGGQAAAAPDRTGAILPGGNSKQPINIEAVKLDYYDKEQKLIYTGSVVATQGDSTLKASILTIFLVPKKPDGGGSGAGSTSKVERMLAVGPVTLLQRDQVGTGDNGVYTKANNSVVLTGNVTLSQGDNVTKGDKLTYDLKTGQAVVTGRVKSMFLPDDDKKTPAADETKRPAKRGAATASGGAARGL